MGGTRPRSEEFGREVQEALQRHGLSPYQVAEQAKGEISHQTVRQMMRGHIPFAEFLVTFARAIGENPNKWLGLGHAGHFCVPGYSVTDLENPDPIE